VKKEKNDEFIRGPIIEYLVAEYLTFNRPDIMAALEQDRDRQSAQLMRQMERKYDKKGDRICDESLCVSTEKVLKCTYCDKHVCKDHNYLEDSPCCYGCWLERFGDKK